MTSLYYMLKQRWVLLTLLIVNFLGTIYGYYWYFQQLKETPVKFMAFVPDSPTASLFLCIVLLGYLFGKNWGLFEALAGMSLFKYGVWAVGMNAFSGYFGYHLNVISYMLIFSHGCMAIEGVLFARFYKFKFWHFGIAALWIVHNDIIDYVFNMAPWYPYLAANFQLIGYATFWLSVVTIVLMYVLRYKKERLSLSLYS